jgi:hypothetical protein
MSSATAGSAEYRAAVVLAARSADALDAIVADLGAAGGVADAVLVDLADRL